MDKFLCCSFFCIFEVFFKRKGGEWVWVGWERLFLQHLESKNAVFISLVINMDERFCVFVYLFNLLLFRRCELSINTFKEQILYQLARNTEVPMLIFLT